MTTGGRPSLPPSVQQFEQLCVVSQLFEPWQGRRVPGAPSAAHAHVPRMQASEAGGGQGDCDGGGLTRAALLCLLCLLCPALLFRRLKETVAKPIVDDVLMAVQQDDGRTPVRLSRGSPSRSLPRVALDLATTVERIQSVSGWRRLAAM